MYKVRVSWTLKKAVSIWLFVFCVCGGSSLIPISANQLFTRISILASDEDYTHASIILFDLSQEKIVDKISLSAELAVASGYWSPDSHYIAAVVGRRTNNLEFSGESICLFSKVGELLWCKEFQLFHISAPVGGLWPAPLAWTSDSQHLSIITSRQFNDASTPEINIIDIDQGIITSRIEITSSVESIELWKWSPNADFAAFIGWNRERQVHELYIVVFIPQFESYLLAPDVGIALDVNQSNIIYVGRGQQPYEAPIEIASLNNNRFSPSLFLEEPRLDSRLVAKELDLSTDTNFIALVSPIPDNSTNESEGLFVLNIETNEIHSPESKFHFIDQLNWSPDTTYIAARVCEGYGPTLCRVQIYSQVGDLISVDTGYIENRDPTWFPQQ